MCTTTKMSCNLCKNKNNKLLKLEEKFLDTKLCNVVKNILADHTIALPLEFLICTECALALLQAEIVLKRLREAIIKDKRAAFNILNNQTQRSNGAEQGGEEEKGNENGVDINNTSNTHLGMGMFCTLQKQQPIVSAFGADALLTEWTFHCTHCAYTSNKSKWYKRHLITKHQLKNPRIYKCPYCNESYQRLLGIRTHIDCVHGNKPRSKRPRRNTSLLNNVSLDDHSENSGDETFLDDDQDVHTNEQYKFECSLCVYETMEANAFKTHLTIKHNMGDAKIYKCKKCSLRFVRKLALHNHVACKHAKKTRLSTQKRKSVPADYECGNISSKEIEINDAKQEDASDAETVLFLRCGQCAYKAEDTKELKRHQVVEHEIAVNANENINLMATLNDDIEEGNEEHAVEEKELHKTQNNDTNEAKVQNGDLEEINKEHAMVSIPVSGAYKQESDSPKVMHSSSIFRKFRDTKNSEFNTMSTQNADSTQSDFEEEHSLQSPQTNLRKKLSLRSILKITPNSDVDSETQDNMEYIFQTPQKMLPPHQRSAVDTSKTDWVFLCSYCDYESTKRKAYKEHIKNEHDINDENIYKCLYCTAAFGHYKSLKAHVTTMHCIDLTTMGETTATFSDSSQDQQYKSTRQITRKRKNAAEFKKTIDSPAPDAASPSPKQLTKRKKVLSCDVCGKIFSSAENLQYHINKLHSADEMCH